MKGIFDNYTMYNRFMIEQSVGIDVATEISDARHLIREIKSFIPKELSDEDEFEILQYTGRKTMDDFIWIQHDKIDNMPAEKLSQVLDIVSESGYPQMIIYLSKIKASKKTKKNRRSQAI
jgi:hypothetical protein